MNRIIFLATLLTIGILSTHASAYAEGFYDFSNGDQQTISSDYSVGNSRMLQVSKCTVELRKRALGLKFEEKSVFNNLYINRNAAVTLCWMPEEQRECYKEQILADYLNYNSKISRGIIELDSYADVCGAIKMNLSKTNYN